MFDELFTLTELDGKWQVTLHDAECYTYEIFGDKHQDYRRLFDLRIAGIIECLKDLKHEQYLKWFADGPLQPDTVWSFDERPEYLIYVKQQAGFNREIPEALHVPVLDYYEWRGK